MNNTFLCIDLKTFYASVECVERNLDPFKTNLVVADITRGKGGICLAISPKMKMLGIKNRCRLFEIPPNVKYIIAKPRMNKYMEYSANIYEIYLKYFSKDDIHIYSIDEVFIDTTHYLKIYKTDGIGIAKKVMEEIYNTYGITATAGIGTNMYLAKIALDILSKHSVTNIGYLDENLYKEKLWHYKPLSDFWQIGKGIEKRLKKYGIYDMYDIAHYDERKLYKEFGINAKYLIQHSKGIEKCTIKEIKNYKPKTNSISTSQILFRDYNYEEAKLILKEMVELKSLDLVQNKLEACAIQLYIGYSKDVISSTGGMRRLSKATNTYKELLNYFIKLYNETSNFKFPIRRIGIAMLNLVPEENEQLNLFIDQEKIDKERKLETTLGTIKNRMGKNSILRGINLEESSTARIRNTLVGGHNGGEA